MVADPTDPQRWLLLANTQFNSYTVVDGTLRRTGGTYPLWYTEDAGDNWEPVLLPADSNSTGWGIEPGGLAFDTTQPGAWRLSARSSNGTWLWRGQNETAPAPVLLVQPLYCYYDFLTLVPGLDQETALYANTSNGCGDTWQRRGLSFAGATGDTLTVSGNTVFSPSNSEAPDLKSMDRLPGTSRAIVGIENRSTGDLYATADYRTTQVSQQYAAGAGWVTAAQDGIYIGGRTGLLAVPDVLAAPTVTSVIGITAGVPVGFVRADRQTQSAVAALSSDKQTLYLRPEVGAAWQAITIPVSQIDPYYIYPERFEVIIGDEIPPDPGPISIEITDSTGNTVDALDLNNEGWPALNAATGAISNPITVTVTLTSNTTEAVVDMEFGSTINDTRFYPFSVPSYCDPPAEGETTFSFSIFNNQCFLNQLIPGVPTTLEWQLWIQPSEAGTLEINVSMYDALVGGTFVDDDTESVEVPQAAITPVVFLHGILGSMTPQNKLLTTNAEVRQVLDPFLGSYWPLMDNLQKMGYELNKTLFPIAYDWRNPNDESAAFLAEQLSTAVIPRAVDVDYVDVEYISLDPVIKKTKADLVVHSMGGLVARSYIQGDDYEDNVRKLVFIASPHKGFPFDYHIWEGMTWSDFLYNADGRAGGSFLLSYLMDNRLWLTLAAKKFKPTFADMSPDPDPFPECIPGPNLLNVDLDTINLLPGQTLLADPSISGVGFICGREVINGWAHSIDTLDSTLAANRGVRSLYEMLPTDDMQYLVNNNSIPSNRSSVWPWGHQTNTFLPSLNANIGNLTTRLGAENIYNIYGSGAPTDSTYEVEQPPSPYTNYWRYGSAFETSLYGLGGINEINEGDDLIPELSTSLRQNGLIPTLSQNNEEELNAQPQAGGARHKEIMFHSEVQRNLVPNFLAGVTLPFETTYFPPLVLDNVGNLFSVNTSCPINLLITDPQGRRLGYDPATGQVLHEIPNSVYTSPGVEPQIILIGDALPGSYQLTATGYDSGNYAIHVDNTTREGLQPIALFGGTTTANEIDSHSFTYYPNSLVAAYSFNEGTGSTVEDLSNYSNTGTISGAAWTTQGYFGNALVFDGTNDWVTVPVSDSLNLTSTLTLEAWVYPTGGTNNWQSVIHKAIPNGLSYGLYALADSGLPGGFVTTSAETPVYDPAPLPLNRWSHLATTYDGTTLRLYVDGTLANSTAISGAVTVTNGELRIGGNAVWGDFFQGRIDEVRIYNRALSASELGHDRLRPIGELPPPMTVTEVAAYGFDEGSGTTTADTIGGNIGTISGAAWTTQGRFGNALDFDGTNDWVTVADSASLDLTSGMTLMAWVNPDSTSGWQKAFAKEAPGETAYALYASTDTDVPGGFVTTSSENGARGSTVLPANTWSHIAVTYDGVRVTFYLNGVAVSSTPAQGSILTSSGVLRIGGDAIWGNFFDGQIDEVRIFAGALHDAEIQELMDIPVTSTP